MFSNKSCFAPLTVAFAGFLCHSIAVAQDPQGAATAEPQARMPVSLQTTDYLVPHISTVPTNAGKRVELFVREKVASRRRGSAPVVLMIHGATSPVVPAFDTQFENYSWMEFLATAGFDVFALDHTGYGLSPRPMMENPCNTSAAEQASTLVTKPLAQPCAPAYPFQLTTIQSDWDEIDTVVDYLRRVRNVDKVSLIGWSRGGPRAGGYAALHPEKVDKLFLFAPAYSKLAPGDPPATLPVPGVPMTVTAAADTHKDWDTNGGGVLAPFTGMCVDQYTPAIRPVLTEALMEFDPIGSTWGASGVRRSPNWNTPQGFNYWGWNTKLANKLTVPTLIIRGDLDTKIPISQITDLLTDLKSVRQKVFVHVECSSHYLQWENQHMALLNASLEWLRDGTYWGQYNGSFAVDKAGDVHPEQ